MSYVHQSAIVEDGAQLGEGVRIGPYCVVGGDVTLGDGVELHSHVIVTGRTTIGAKVAVFPFAAIGHRPQDLKYKGEETRIEIGENTTIREHVTINPGTAGGGGLTRVGNNCLVMIAAHVAHDCKIGDGTILVNNVTLGGHVTVGNFAIVGGLSGVHQFVRIGHHSMIGGCSAVENDVIPYGSVMGNRARLSGLNLVGLKRRGFSRDDIHILRNAYRLLFAEEGTLQERLEDVAKLFKGSQPVEEIIEFIRAPSSRGLCQPQHDRGE